MVHVPPEEKIYLELVQVLKKSPEKVNFDRLERAYDFARRAHGGQFRASGEAYICHPLEVAKILAGLKVDEDTLIAALLHDVPEDTDTSIKEIERRFGRGVGRLVFAVTKLSKVHYQHSMDNRQVDSLRRLFLETAKDVRVAIIKLADRLHNMRTLRYLRPDKQQRIAKETMEIFAPLANVYGIFHIRRELEDLSFKVLQPEEYGRIENFVMEHEKKRGSFVKDTIAVLKKELKRWKIPVTIEGRPKHYYSIYQKMVKHQKPLNDIYDYFAIRILTHSLEECYQVLGVVHSVFKPKPGRFKDYIAFPKANGYQSLHTTVVGLEGKLTEVQIRSEAMHYECEYGAASHLLYKDGKGSAVSDSLARLKHFKNKDGFVRTLHEDLLQKRIFVFSGEGDVVDLPEGASVLDYVYTKNIPIGPQQLKPLVNNRPYSLLGILQSGDHIQISRDSKKNEAPQIGWLGHVKTSKAKEAIRDYFREQSMETRMELGRGLLQQVLDHQNHGLVRNLDDTLKVMVCAKFAMRTFDEILVAIGEGTLTATEVYKALFPELQLGFFMRTARWWHAMKRRFNFGEDDYKYRIKIVIEAYDRVGLLREELDAFYELKLPIITIHGNGYDVQRVDPFLPDGSPANPELISKDTIEILVDDHEQLISLFDRIERVPGVIRVQRVFRQKTASFVVLSLMTVAYFLWHPVVIQYVMNTDFAYRRGWVHALVYAGLLVLMALLLWLRSMGNKTFPHFEETKHYWSLSFGMSFLAIGVVFLDNALYDLRLNMPLTAGLSVLILLLLFFSYRRHVRQRTQHLNRLKVASEKAQ